MVESVIKQIVTKAGTTKSEDKLTNLVGQLGKWQLIVFFTVSAVKLSSGWVQMAILFLTPKLTYWCAEFQPNSTEFLQNTTELLQYPTEFLQNATEFLQNMTELQNWRDVENSTCYKDCMRYEYDTSPLDNTIISEWDLVCEKNWLASFTQTVLQFGILTGSIVFGFLSDRYGRKHTFLAAVTIMIIFAFGIPFSPNYVVFTTLRFFLGFGTSGTMVISFVIVMETVGPDYREMLGCLFQIPFILGHMTVPLFAYFLRSWDKYCLAMAVPQLMYFGYFFVLNESPRWLVSVGRVDQATIIVKRAAELNKLPTEKIDETLTKLSQEMQTSEQPKPNYSDLFQRSLRRQTLCCCFMWLVCGVIFFGFNQYISQTSPDPFLSVAAAGAIQIPANLIAIWLIKNLGRKKTTVVIFLLGGACILALGYVPKIFWLTFTLGTFGVSFAAAVTATIYIYTTELFPTVVRNMGMGACSTSMRVGSMVAPFVSNLSMTVPWLPTVIFGLAGISAGLLCLLLPETKGRRLPDTLHDVGQA